MNRDPCTLTCALARQCALTGHWSHWGPQQACGAARRVGGHGAHNLVVSAWPVPTYLDCKCSSCECMLKRSWLVMAHSGECPAAPSRLCGGGSDDICQSFRKSWLVAELGLPSKRAAAGSCGMPVDTELHKAARDGARSHRFSRSFAHLGPSS